VIGAKKPAGCRGVHFTNLALPLSEERRRCTDPHDRWYAQRAQRFDDELVGYCLVQQTRPQTIGYGLPDSPAGLASWVYVKFHDWTDNTGSPETVLTLDEMLDDISIYWFTNTGVSSARLYWEDRRDDGHAQLVDVPAAFSLFRRDIEGPRDRTRVNGSPGSCGGGRSTAVVTSPRSSNPPCSSTRCAPGCGRCAASRRGRHEGVVGGG
jgi:hypothetical protein